ncbi:hypothetical protein CAI21_05760 [Alkalilimnicola ehrlichii]|uniref:Ancillary SecYEG translocon subunit n=1 Tax=Alkalilimnicola ehrlichii TaxID=351052 RepID=A0A3E0WZ58_9GAMM|nr:tetratricopeptide repeat protein [Alkalilimnicola ehrlichii]RFA30550.1 hypothetical protein CAI21_05760 [Alkalilimnicola ehrlichii]RFA38098.1 hypothetical protein CAL65_07130 [Alkalilimnicola ehrlichii]
MSYGSDEEQIEAIKRWWRENGKAVVAGVILAVGGVVGWQFWDTHRENVAREASNEYLVFLEQVQADADSQTVVARGEAIVDQYGNTTYATLTSFWLAQFLAERGDYEAAEQHLRWVVQHGDSDNLRHIARLRLGRLLLGAGEYQAALDALRTGSEGGFRSQYQELRGDIYLAQGESAAAERAYRSALSAADIDGQRRSLIELKLVDMGVEPSEPLS